MHIQMDSQRVRLERDRRAWSQAHLATVAGLGLRTVQRIETTGFAAPESLRALASVFSLEISELRIAASDLNHEPLDGPTASNSTDELFWFVFISSVCVFLGIAAYSFFADGLGRYELGRAAFVGLSAFFCGSVPLAGAQWIDRRSLTRNRTSARRGQRIAA